MNTVKTYLKVCTHHGDAWREVGKGRHKNARCLMTFTRYAFHVAVCPTCGQYLTMVEKVFNLQEEVAVLEQRVAVLEASNITCTPSNDATSNGGDERRMNDCVADEEEIRTFEHDTFTTLKDGRICYCNVS